MARQEPNGQWRADATVNGKRKTKICDTQEEAEKLETSFKKQILDGKPLNKVRAQSQITLRQAGNNCLNNPKVGWRVQGEPSPHGRKQGYYINSFCEFWGDDKPLREIKEYIPTPSGGKKKDADWEDYISQFGEWTATNNRRACCINKIFSQARADGHINADNHLKIKRKKEKLTRARAYTREEEKMILKECDTLGYNDLKDFVICLIETGASPEDLRTGNSKNILRFPNQDGVTFNFNRGKTDIAVSVGLMERSKDILMRRSNQPRFFMVSYRVLYNKWQDIRERLGKSDDKEWIFYTCRHTCASRLAEQGCTLVEVADWLGHAPNSPVTRRYIHFFPTHKLKIVDKMNEYNKKLSADSVRLVHGVK